MRTKRLRKFALAATLVALSSQQVFGGYLVRSFFDEFGLGLPADAQGIDPVVNAVDFDRDLGGAFPEELRMGFTNIQDDVNSDDGIDNFGSLVRGYIQAPQTGTYTIAVASDDDSELYINTNGHQVLSQRDSDFLIGEETEWTNGDIFTGPRADQRSSQVELEKGGIYYVELYHREGGGGSFIQVGWILPDGTAQPIIPAGSLIAFGAPGETTFAQATSVAISEQPLDANVTESQSFSLSISAHGPQPLSFQWSKDGQEIEGAILQSLDVSEAQLSDSGTYSVKVTGPNGQSVNSGSASVSVGADTVAPGVVSIVGSGEPHGILVTYSEKVSEATATDAGNYSFTGQDLTISGVSMVSNSSVIISVSEFNTDPLTLRISGVKDRSSRGNTIATANHPVTLAVPGATYLLYEGNPFGFYSAEDRGKGRYPENYNAFDGEVQGNQNLFDRRASSTVSYLELPNSGDITVNPNSNVQDNYGSVIFGYIVPSETANYHFYLAVDDNSELYLSTDDDPANSVMIAREDEWNGIRVWTGTAGDINQSPTNFPNGFNLQAGERYYFEVISQEGGGGDNVAVAWNTTGVAPENGNGDNIITSNHLQSTVEPGPITITEHPASASTREGEPVTFKISYEGTDSLAAAFQWYKNGEAIGGATSPSYTIDNPQVADNGATIHAEVFNRNGVFNRPASEGATLTVINDNDAPLIASLSGSPTKTQVLLKFNEPVDADAVSNASNYSIAGISVESVSFNGTDAVNITTSEQGDGVDYTVKVSGVTDRFGNSADAEWSFTSAKLTQGGLTALMYAQPGTSLDFYPAPRGIGIHPEGAYEFGEPQADGGNMDLIANNKSSVIPFYESPNSGDIDVNPGNSNDNYAQIIFGWIQPAETGNYRFFVAVDDNAEFYLSTDDSPANSQLLATEDNWANVREWANREDKDNELNDGATGTTSDSIRLEAGQRYYTELIMSEGGGGDNAAVAWAFSPSGDAQERPANGSHPIAGEFLWSNISSPSLNPLVFDPPAPSVALEAADSVNGPWSAVGDAGNPYSTSSADAAKFYRLRGSDSSLSISQEGGNVSISW